MIHLPPLDLLRLHLALAYFPALLLLGSLIGVSLGVGGAIALSVTICCAYKQRTVSHSE